VLVQEVLDAMRARYALTIQEVTTAVEEVTFKLPRELAA
jgi:4-hydroxy-3-methylbut-2-enyl diphosphate reductase